jgi:diguanylate cyclase (GGDEF)-like protein
VQLGLLLAAVAIDGGGAASPLVLPLMLPLLPAAWSLSPLGVCLLGAVGVTGVALLAHAGNALSATAFATAAVMGLVTTASGITARAEQRLRETQASLNAELAALAHRDGLTGCLNHRAFQERLDEEAGRAHRHGRDLALLLVDLDEFKELNDTYGHPAGDRVLRAIGTILADASRSGDVAGRLGGDEFALLLPDTSAAQAVPAAERIRARVGELVDPEPITASIGISALPDSAVGPRHLVDQADEALYAAKHSGRGQIRVYGAHRAGFAEPTHPGATGSPAATPPGHPEQVTGRSSVGAHQLVARLVRDVIDRGQLAVAFQPVVRLSDGALVAYRAVAGLGDGQLPLARWLDVAENVGEARRQLEEAWWAAVARWGPPPRGTRVFVEVTDHAAPGDLRRVLARELPRSGEQPAAGPEADHRALTGELAAWSRAMGALSVGEALTGGTEPIDRLGGLEPRWLQLPRRLIAGCDQQPGRLALIAALRAFADRAGGELLATGVGREEEMRALRTAGLRYAAGSLWGEPGPPWPAAPDGRQTRGADRRPT